MTGRTPTFHMICVLVTAGFTITGWNDVTIEALKWIGQQRPPTQGFKLGLVMGPRFGQMSANLARNIREGRVRFVMGVCTADGARNRAGKEAVNTP
jgi:hypothetical protein